MVDSKSLQLLLQLLFYFYYQSNLYHLILINQMPFVFFDRIDITLFIKVGKILINLLKPIY